jgi:hypothetical protein
MTISQFLMKCNYLVQLTIDTSHWKYSGIVCPCIIHDVDNTWTLYNGPSIQYEFNKQNYNLPIE